MQGCRGNGRLPDRNLCLFVLPSSLQLKAKAVIDALSWLNKDYILLLHNKDYAVMT